MGPRAGEFSSSGTSRTGFLSCFGPVGPSFYPPRNGCLHSRALLFQEQENLSWKLPTDLPSLLSALPKSATGKEKELLKLPKIYQDPLSLGWEKPCLS